MSQMPDKIWLHKDTKYNTGDIVCGYQYEFAEGIEDEGGIKNFVEYVPKDTFIEKAMKWLDKELPVTDLSSSNLFDIEFKVLDEESKRVFIDEFRRYMRGE